MSTGRSVDRLLQPIASIAAIVETLRGKVARLDNADALLTHLERISVSCREVSRYLESNTRAPEHSSTARHEIRNQLNHIAGPAQILLRRITGREHKELDRILDLVEECVSIIDAYSVATHEVVRALDTRAVVARTADPAKILIAEDDIENRRFLAEVLTSEGHRIELANDGPQALARVQESDCDLLLLDLGLPGLSGFEVLEKLQRNGWQTPVIIVTGQRGIDAAVRCIEHGADDFLTKPIQIEILRARVKSCIEKIRLREREFGQFFPPKLARQFARRPSLVNDLPSRDAEVSIMFCDLRNFTAISERLGPEKTTRWLRGVMNDLCEIIIANEGVLVDFAGDEVMAMWGAPEEIEDHAQRACMTAVQILRRLPRIDMAWRDRIGTETDLAVGINTGRAMVGHVGTARKTKYGALGDAVNVGSRVLGATNYFKSRVLISGATQNRLGPDWTGGVTRRLAKVRVKNLARALDLYELRPAGDPESDRDLDSRYAIALDHFEKQAWRAAADELEALLERHPNDEPSAVLLLRVRAALEPGGSAADPVWTLRGN